MAQIKLVAWCNSCDAPVEIKESWDTTKQLPEGVVGENFVLKCSKCGKETSISIEVESIGDKLHGDNS